MQTRIFGVHCAYQHTAYVRFSLPPMPLCMCILHVDSVFILIEYNTHVWNEYMHSGGGYAPMCGPYRWWCTISSSSMYSHIHTWFNTFILECVVNLFSVRYDTSEHISMDLKDANNTISTLHDSEGIGSQICNRIVGLMRCQIDFLSIIYEWLVCTRWINERKAAASKSIPNVQHFAMFAFVDFRTEEEAGRCKSDVDSFPLICEYLQENCNERVKRLHCEASSTF